MPKMGISAKIAPRKTRQSAAPAKQSAVRAAPKKPVDNKPKPGLAAALFSATQQRVLGLLFGQPDRSFFASELIALAGVGSGAVQRELARLEAAGLVATSRVGNQKHFQAQPNSPIYSELVGIITKTVGIAEPLRAALSPFTKRIGLAFVYGSIAKGGDTTSSDIDIMIIGEKIRYEDLYSTLESAETKLGRKINPSIYTPAELAKKRGHGGFLDRVLNQPKIFLLGNEDLIGARLD